MGVVEEFLDADEVDALFQEQVGGRVAGVAEADPPESGLAEEVAETAGEVV
ncbi:putative phage integrase [Streptomyces sp. Tu6071]|nr:putative phage integrase [Streptomyces sp. Tu6071]